ncbi:MAG: hypothetical protein AAB553_07120 [Patescibacteria group bacterium]
MKNLYWFRARKHGIGWVPVTWQGWLVLLMYVIALVYVFFNHDYSPSVQIIWTHFWPKIILLTLVLIIVTYIKGEPTTWHKRKS